MPANNPAAHIEPPANNPAAHIEPPANDPAAHIEPPANNPAGHVKVPMNELLENYVTLKKDPRVIEHDDNDLQLLEEQLRQNPDDAVALTALTDRQQKLQTAYRSVLVCLAWRLTPIHTCFCILIPLQRSDCRAHIRQRSNQEMAENY